MISRKLVVTVGAAAFGVGLAGFSPVASAALIVENLSSEFGPTSTLGGTAFGATTPFTLAAEFDTASAVPGSGGETEFPVLSMTLTISGHGTYNAVPGANLNVTLYDLRDNFGYVAGLADASDSNGFWSAFSVGTPSSPPFNSSSPVPTVFSSPFLNNKFGSQYSIALSGVGGGLVVNDVGSDPATASLTAAVVPEPVTAALIGIGSLALLARRRRVSA